MSKLTLALTLALALPFAQTALAQSSTPDTKAPADASGAPSSDAKGGANAGPGLSMGENVEGKMYVKDTQGDWTVRCFHTKDNKDPCELYQLLKDEKKNPVAEMIMVPLPKGGQAVAGATIITPLETLLTQQLTIAIDGSGAKRYPFVLCNPVGCFARIGLTQADLDGYRKGAKGTMEIVSAADPRQPLDLPISLKGFTAGFDEVASNNEKNGINMGGVPQGGAPATATPAPAPKPAVPSLEPKKN
ncbi:invasion associated locus B family protein [Acidimangrovimonas sediminis]|uniref:invasion associated locus B family protein n=1 Tax=Acidimangrovimonas sediminis TaxID=2056283 RepID=UPI000C80F4B6|nr:invasion associated locus B family protein [Acidimangrovimonas sediminis]